MISLSLPEGNVRECLRSCIATVADADLVVRIISAEAHFEAAEREYGRAGGRSELYDIPSSKHVADAVTVEEMKWLYKNKLAKLGSPSRWIYDRLRMKSKICPLCNCRTVGTLDHYLAQAGHALYTVTPINLLPACTDCNKVKGEYSPQTLQDQTLHPYYDELPVDIPWLKVCVTEEVPPGIVYAASPPIGWDENLSARVVKHFQIFELGILYSAKASSEVVEMRQTFKTTHALNGAEGLRDYLAQQARDRRLSSPHSWKAALYEGLSLSDWFVHTGFALI